MIRASLPVAFLLFPGLALHAQSLVVPNALAGDRGTGGLNTLTRNAGNPRTYMLGLAASELADLPSGAVVTGLSFRSYVGPASPADWPASQTSWTGYEITIGNAIPLASWTPTFLANFSGTPVTVRTGPMVIEEEAFTNDTSLPSPRANAWGEFFWDFQQTFPYTGGDLAVLFTHPGSDQTSTLFLDTVESSPGAHGRALTASAFRAVTAASTAAPFTVVRLHYGFGAGCPGTGGAVPMLVQTNDITGGGDVLFSLANAPANGVAIYVLGLVQTNVPLPGGCTLLAVPLVTLPVVLSPLGRHRLELNAPSGLAATVYFQGFAIDPGAPAGFTATNGATLTVRP